MTEDERVLPMWIVYKNPSDVEPFPEGDTFVARRCWIGAGKIEHEEGLVKGTALHAIHAWLRLHHPDLVNLGRHKDDDPVIVEVWV